jgi:hypothetical protein
MMEDPSADIGAEALGVADRRSPDEATAAGIWQVAASAGDQTSPC